MTSPQVDASTLLPGSLLPAKTGPLPSARPRAFQALPHVSIGDVTGLIELVNTHGGRDDLYQIGRLLHLEVDDLLPLVEAAELLGLATVDEGDIVLTEAGQQFAAAGVLEEKKVFRDQALASISILRTIVYELQNTPAHTLPERHFLALLEQHFSEEEAQSQLHTAINWGRYAELFTFQDDRELFRLDELEAE